MANWTQHTKLTFHGENNFDVSHEWLLSFLANNTELCCMIEDYNGFWQGRVTPGLKVTHIAACDADVDAVFNELNELIKQGVGSSCLMPTRETIEVFCECDADHTD